MGTGLSHALGPSVSAAMDGAGMECIFPFVLFLLFLISHMCLSAREDRVPLSLPPLSALPHRPFFPPSLPPSLDLGLRPRRRISLLLPVDSMKTLMTLKNMACRNP